MAYRLSVAHSRARESVQMTPVHQDVEAIGKLDEVLVEVLDGVLALGTL